ncbi:heme-degrading monooxygenase HmoA [Paenibacillus sp. LBL]|jgi:heme-degrading monooxygenase HmoA|nr:heme-degrading monooxygenase HmoA [Paenibacillus sp. LBL]
MIYRVNERNVSRSYTYSATGKGKRMTEYANTPKPPYYACIFVSKRTEGDRGYGAMSDKMAELAAQQPGYLGVESARDEGLGITVSYWDSLEAIRLWKENAAHQVAQERGKNEWHESFGLRICKVERDSFYKL